FFFFSSRRRHTRFSRDWSSDVCSSDLKARKQAAIISVGRVMIVRPISDGNDRGPLCSAISSRLFCGLFRHQIAKAAELAEKRGGSEERRVGTEGRERRWGWSTGSER